MEATLSHTREHFYSGVEKEMKNYYGAGSDLTLNTTVFARNWERKKSLWTCEKQKPFVTGPKGSAICYQKRSL